MGQSYYGRPAPIVILILLIILFIVAVVRWVVMLCENRLLFPGCPIDYYRKIKRGRFYFLNSGGGLLHYSHNTENECNRKILFLHGNGGSLDLLEEVLDELHSECGFNVYALEYYTYGICWKRKQSDNDHISCILQQNLMESWTLFGDEKTIIASFSLGGGLLGSTWNSLFPCPAQMLFINTFCDLPRMISEMLPSFLGKCVGPFMQTQWIAEPPNDPNCTTQVTIICTRDDHLIPMEESKRLCATFAALNPTFVILPDGGHALGLIRHLKYVTERGNILLPCEI